MTDKLREAVQMALDALERVWHSDRNIKHSEAIKALRAALAAKEPIEYTGNGTAGRESDVRPTGFFFQADKKQGPVALETVYETIIHWDEGGGKRSRRELARRIVALYTSPPASKPWVGLTDQEIRDWWRIENGLEDCDMAKLVDFTLAVRAIEAKLKEKNA